MHVERTFTVPRPVATVFDYLADFTHTEQWDPGTLRTTRTGGDGGLGTTYRNVSSFLGRHVELDYEVVVFERPTHVVFRGTHAKATSADDLTLTPTAGADGEGAGTQIHYRADFAFSRWIELVAPVFVRPRLERLADITVERMRATLAGLPGDPAR